MNVRTTAVLAAAVAAFGMSAATLGHETFLKADRSMAPAGSGEQVVRLINGTFDKSENSISRDRMQNVSIVANGKVSNPPASAWSDDEKKTLSTLKYTAGGPGTYVIAVSTKPKILTMSPEDFIDYLKHDGVIDTLKVFEKENKLKQVRERYSKHVRTIVQVGDKKTDDYAKPLGYPVEILLDQNPYDLKFGNHVSFRVLYQGKPLANQVVRASYEGFHGHDDSGGHINAHELRTDKDGRASFLLSNKALWYISLIYMQKINDTEADYESNWATATFQIR
jgi:uncharacterized GH25 family protein